MRSFCIYYDYVLFLFFRRCERVFEQHCNCHRTNAARYGSDVACFRFNRGKINVALELVVFAAVAKLFDFCKKLSLFGFLRHLDYLGIHSGLGAAKLFRNDDSRTVNDKICSAKRDDNSPFNLLNFPRKSKYRPHRTALRNPLPKNSRTWKRIQTLLRGNARYLLHFILFIVFAQRKYFVVGHVQNILYKNYLIGV